MKLDDLFEQKKPKIPKRPKKDLIFQGDTAWKADIAGLHGQHVFAKTQHGKIYAVDSNKRIVYGMYDDATKCGVVFFQPKHITPGIRLEVVT